MLQLHSRTLWNYKNVKKTNDVLNKLVKMFNLKDVSEMITNEYILDMFEQILCHTSEYERAHEAGYYGEVFWQAFLTNNNHSLYMVVLLSKIYDIKNTYDRYRSDLHAYYRNMKPITSLFMFKRSYLGKYTNISNILMERTNAILSFKRLCNSHFKYKSFYGLLYYITSDYYLYRLQQEGTIKIYYDLDHWNVLTILPVRIRDIVIKRILMDDFGKDYIKYLTTNNYKEEIEHYVWLYDKPVIFDPSDEYTNMFCKFCEHWITNNEELTLNDNIKYYIYNQHFVKFFIEYIDFVNIPCVDTIGAFMEKYKPVLFAKKQATEIIISKSLYDNIEIFARLKALKCVRFEIIN